MLTWLILRPYYEDLDTTDFYKISLIAHYVKIVCNLINKPKPSTSFSFVINAFHINRT